MHPIFYVLIYIAGFFAAYYLAWFGWKESEKHEWESVFIRFILGIFSWAAFAGLLAWLILAVFKEFIKKLANRKEPPKWF